MSAPISLCKNLQKLFFRRSIAKFDKIVLTRSIHLKNKSPQDDNTVLYIETDEDELEKIRNVSGLRPSLRRRLAHVDEMPDAWNEYMVTRKFQRRMYARFGSKSGMNPGIMWPSKSELKEIVEDEHEFEPSLQVMTERLQARKEEHEKRNFEKLQRVEKNMANMANLIKQHEQQKQQKLEDKLNQENKKQQALEEAREFFGYYVSPQDDKFKEMMELKEKEERKKIKDKKRQEKMAKMTARLQAEADES